MGGTVIGDEDVEISGVGAIEEAEPGEITFIANPKYLSKLSETKASAVIVSPDVTRSRTNPFSPSPIPTLAFAKILSLYTQKPYRATGDRSQGLGQPDGPAGQRGDVSIPLSIVGDGCSIGDRVDPLSRGLRGGEFLHRRRIDPSCERLHLSGDGHREKGHPAQRRGRRKRWIRIREGRKEECEDPPGGTCGNRGRRRDRGQHHHRSGHPRQDRDPAEGSRSTTSSRSPTMW